MKYPGKDCLNTPSHQVYLSLSTSLQPFTPTTGPSSLVPLRCWVYLFFFVVVALRFFFCVCVCVLVWFCVLLLVFLVGWLVCFCLGALLLPLLFGLFFKNKTYFWSPLNTHFSLPQKKNDVLSKLVATFISKAELFLPLLIQVCCCYFKQFFSRNVKTLKQCNGGSWTFLHA